MFVIFDLPKVKLDGAIAELNVVIIMADVGNGSALFRQVRLWFSYE